MAGSVKLNEVADDRINMDLDFLKKWIEVSGLKLRIVHQIRTHYILKS